MADNNSNKVYSLRISAEEYGLLQRLGEAEARPGERVNYSAILRRALHAYATSRVRPVREATLAEVNDKYLR